MKTSLYAGFDLGGTQLKYGLLDEQHRIVFKGKTPTPETIRDLLRLIRSTWDELRKEGKGKITAAGFGFPGFFSLKEKKILKSPNYPELDGFDLIPALSSVIDVPFLVDNDANLAAFGEWACGAGKHAQSLILITLGTGVGSGIILDGKLWRGKCGFAGELGHVTVNPEGETCNCGSRGCLETEVSAPKIAKNYNLLRNKEETLSAEDVFQRAKKGDEHARQSFALAGYYLGIGLGIAINFLNPETILLGGGVMAAGEYILSPALAEARRRCFQGSFECCDIKKASLGNDAGFIGAASLAREMLKG